MAAYFTAPHPYVCDDVTTRENSARKRCWKECHLIATVTTTALEQTKFERLQQAEHTTPSTEYPLEKRVNSISLRWFHSCPCCL